MRAVPPAALLAAVALLLPAAAPAAGSCAGSRADASTPSGRHAVRCLVNAARAAHGAAPLRPAAPLALAARRHARAMARRDFFAHVSPGGSTPETRAARAGWRGSALGETIAWGAGGRATARGVVRRWLASAGHRRVLLDPDLREIGIGSVHGVPVRGFRGRGIRATVVADVGRR